MEIPFCGTKFTYGPGFQLVRSKVCRVALASRAEKALAATLPDDTAEQKKSLPWNFCCSSSLPLVSNRIMR